MTLLMYVLCLALISLRIRSTTKMMPEMRKYFQKTPICQ